MNTFISEFGVHRSEEQVKKKFQNVKAKTLLKNRESRHPPTGGGGKVVWTPAETYLREFLHGRAITSGIQGTRESQDCGKSSGKSSDVNERNKELEVTSDCGKSSEVNEPSRELEVISEMNMTCPTSINDDQKSNGLKNTKRKRTDDHGMGMVTKTNLKLDCSRIELEITKLTLEIQKLNLEKEVLEKKSQNQDAIRRYYDVRTSYYEKKIVTIFIRKCFA